MRLDCVNGKYKGPRQLLQQIYPYGFYHANLLLLFPVQPLDLRQPPKEIVHGVVVRDHVEIYRFYSFEGI
jgi:hypothetical protein